MDIYNFDNVVKGINSRFGLPTEWENDDAVIKKIREARQQQQQLQESLMAAESLGKATGGLNKTIEPDSVAEAVRQQVA